MALSPYLEVPLQAAVAVLYAAVAVAVARRAVSGDARFANRAYAWWWGCLAAISGAGVASTVLAELHLWSYPALMTWNMLLFPILFIALASLLYFLVYLYTGKRGAWRPIAAFYLVFHMALLYLIFWMEPVGLTVEEGRSTIEYARQAQVEDSWIGPAFGIALVLPAFIGAVAYGSLWFRTKDRLQRFRIATVSGSIIIWFGSSMWATVSDVGGGAGWALVSRLIAVGAAGANLIAYRMPRSLARRLVGRATAATTPADPPPAPAEPADGTEAGPQDDLRRRPPRPVRQESHDREPPVGGP